MGHKRHDNLEFAFCLGDQWAISPCNRQPTVALISHTCWRAGREESSCLGSIVAVLAWQSLAAVDVMVIGNHASAESYDDEVSSKGGWTAATAE